VRRSRRKKPKNEKGRRKSARLQKRSNGWNEKRSYWQAKMQRIRCNKISYIPKR